MALNETHFLFARRAATSVYKFKVREDPAIYVWLGYADGSGSLHTTREAGPYRVEDDLEPAPFPTLEELLAERKTTKDQWTRDLMAQFGERVGWRV